MTTRIVRDTRARPVLDRNYWLRVAVSSAAVSIVTVLVVQALALAIRPDLALFKPLDSYPRTALFTAVPALGATAVFVWLAKHHDQPVRKFLILSALMLLLSFIPDYALPLEGKSLLGSTTAALMHLVAGISTVAMIVSGYRARVDQ